MSTSLLRLAIFSMLLVTVKCTGDGDGESDDDVSVSTKDFPRINFCNCPKDADQTVVDDAMKKVSDACKKVNADYNGGCILVEVLLVGEHDTGDAPKSRIWKDRNLKFFNSFTRKAIDEISHSNSESATETKNFPQTEGQAASIDPPPSYPASNAVLQLKEIGMCWDSNKIFQKCVTEDTTRTKLIVWELVHLPQNKVPYTCTAEKVI